MMDDMTIAQQNEAVPTEQMKKMRVIEDHDETAAGITAGMVHRGFEMMQRNDQSLSRPDVYVGRLRLKADMPNEATPLRDVREAGFILRAAS
jgi:hypothetical protein